MRLSNIQRRMAFLGVIPVLALVVGGAAVTVSTIRGKLDYDFGSTYDAPRNGVSIVTDVPVAVTPSTDGKVHVNVTGTYISWEPSVDVRKSAQDVLEVATACRDSGCRVDLAVQLPSSTQLKLTTSGVPVDLVRLTGNVQVVANDGPVDAVQLQSDRVSVSSRGGSVDLSFVSPPGNVEATTTNGSIHLLVPSGAYAIDAAAVSGSTELNLPNALGAQRTLHLHATYGSITVDTPG
jgi:DUF4097 and DUF4098 domain-containing protein YvlB